MTCAICRRETRGHQFDPSLIGRKGPIQKACSWQHLDVILKLFQEGKVYDPSPNEEKAIVAGGQSAGHFLEQIGQTNLALLASDQYAAFWRAFLEGFYAKLDDIEANSIPF